MPFPSVTYTFTNGTTADATQVSQDFTDVINGFSDGTKNLNMSAGTFAGAFIANGAVTIGASSANLLVINASLNSSVGINTTNSYDFGSATVAMRSFYLADAGSAARSTRIIGATVASSWTLTLPTAVPSTTGFVLSSDTSGVSSWVDRRKVPTIQTFTSGTGTYTTAANAVYIRVRMVGGGGGGGGSGTAASGDGGAGGNSTFGTTLLVANGGQGGHGSTNNSNNAGGTASLGSGPIGIAIQGASGQGDSSPVAINVYTTPGNGGSTPFGGAGGGGAINSVGVAAIANTGSGGGGGASNGSAGTTAGGGGAAGGYVDAIIGAPSATYAYAIGAAGTAGTAGTNGLVGGAGSLGFIEVTEYYQ